MSDFDEEEFFADLAEQMEDLGNDLDPNLGDVNLDETGLSLPIDLGSDQDRDQVPTREVTAEDLEAFAAIKAELAARSQPTDIDPSLARVELLMDILGNPERSFPAIHVAGTNGKTSVVRMIESLIRAFHRRTGRATSPHLQVETETIAIDGQPLHPADFVRIYREIEPYIAMVDQRSAEEGQPGLSAYEVLIGITYAAFADAPVDVAVVETGLGGTWDATNVINADVCVFTPIAHDHGDLLGQDLAAIASVKAGIMKSRWDMDDLLTPPDNVAVIAEQDPEAMRVLLERAVAVDAQVARFGSEFGVVSQAVAVGGQQLHLRGLAGDYEDIFLPLHGGHQAANAAVALAAVEAFFGAGPGRQLDLDTVREGFGTVTTPGRLERVRSAPTVFLDAAHNPHGAKALGAALDSDFDFQRLVGVVGVLADKDACGILMALEPYLHEVVITQNTSPRAMPAEQLADLAREIFGEERVHEINNLPGAIELAVELAEDTEVLSGAGVIITGSVVTCGEARTLFGKEPA